MEYANEQIKNYLIKISKKLNENYNGIINQEKLEKAIEMFKIMNTENIDEAIKNKIEEIDEYIKIMVKEYLERQEKEKKEFEFNEKERKKYKFEQLKKLYEQTKEKYQNKEYEIVELININNFQSANETRRAQLKDEFGNIIYGFYKTDTSPNEYELLVSRLGKIFNIPVADYFLNFSNGTVDGVSISCLPDEENYEFISGYDFVKNYPEVSNVVNYIKANPNEPKPELTKEQTKYYMDILLKGFEERIKEPIQLENLKRNYFETVLFNFILDQKDYNYTNFAVLFDKRNNSYQMGPLFDNGAVKFNQPLEGTMITTLGRSKKDDIMDLLFNDYYKYISGFLNRIYLNDNLENNINECIKDTLFEKDIEIYKKLVFESLKKVNNKETELKLNNVFKNILGNSIPKEILDKKINEYLKSNSKIDMVSFVYNDLNKFLLSKNIEKTDEMIKLLESLFGVSGNQIVENSKSVIANNIKPGQMPIEQNHILVNETLQMLCKKLTENNIDYYLVGALPCYLLTGEKDSRYHDDIDLMLNEQDIPKVQKILEETEFEFNDRRIDTPKRKKEGSSKPTGDHEVMAQHKYSEFHLGFFCFERGIENEVIHKEYFKDDNGNLMVYKHMITPEQSKLNYDDRLHTYGNAKFKMASLESTYAIKKFTMNNPGREKDKTDVEMIERSGKLDINKIRQMQSIPRLEERIEPVTNLFVNNNELQIDKLHKNNIINTNNKKVEIENLKKIKNQMQNFNNNQNIDKVNENVKVKKLFPTYNINGNGLGFTNIILISLILFLITTILYVIIFKNI